MTARLHVSDLVRREKIASGDTLAKLDIRTEADGSHTLTWVYRGGRMRTERTAVCLLVHPWGERAAP